MHPRKPSVDTVIFFPFGKGDDAVHSKKDQIKQSNRSTQPLNSIRVDEPSVCPKKFAFRPCEERIIRLYLLACKYGVIKARMPAVVYIHCVCTYVHIYTYLFHRPPHLVLQLLSAAA